MLKVLNCFPHFNCFLSFTVQQQPTPQQSAQQREFLRQQEEYRRQQQQAAEAQRQNELVQQQLLQEQDRLAREREQMEQERERIARQQQQQREEVSVKDTVRGILESSKFGNDFDFARPKSAGSRVIEARMFCCGFYPLPISVSPLHSCTEKSVLSLSSLINLFSICSDGK